MYQIALEYTDIIKQTLQHKDLVLTIANIIRGVLSSVMGDRNVVSDDKKRSSIWLLILCLPIQCRKSYSMIKVKSGMVIQVFL